MIVSISLRLKSLKVSPVDAHSNVIESIVPLERLWSADDEGVNVSLIFHNHEAHKLGRYALV